MFFSKYAILCGLSDADFNIFQRLGIVKSYQIKTIIFMSVRDYWILVSSPLTSCLSVDFSKFLYHLTDKSEFFYSENFR